MSESKIERENEIWRRESLTMSKIKNWSHISLADVCSASAKNPFAQNDTQKEF